MEFSSPFLSLWLKPNLVANINFNIAEMLASHMNEQCDLHPGLAYNLKTISKYFGTSRISDYAQKVFFHDTLEFLRYSNLYTYFLGRPFEMATAFFSAS